MVTIKISKLINIKVLPVGALLPIKSLNSWWIIEVIFLTINVNWLLLSQYVDGIIARNKKVLNQLLNRLEEEHGSNLEKRLVIIIFKICCGIH